MFWFGPHPGKVDTDLNDKTTEISDKADNNALSNDTNKGNDKIDIVSFKQKLLQVKQQMDDGEIDEIPLYARPKMLDFDYNKDSYVIVSYSRKDFVKVYLFLAHLYNEGYRFWYDNGMKGTRKWIEEYKEKFLNDNCLGTVTFFSDNYISDSTKEELSIIYNQNGYLKHNVMISLISLDNMQADKMLKNAIVNDRITIENASAIKPVLSEIIKEEKQKTIHRYNGESDISYLTDKIGETFNIRKVNNDINEINQSDFAIRYGILYKYMGRLDYEIIIPQGVKMIGKLAFEGLEHIRKVVIQNGVTCIGTGAFNKCTSLEEIIIPDTITYIQSSAFIGCRSLKMIVLPNSVQRLGNQVFNRCTALQTIILSNKIKSLESKLFANCKNLISITIPHSVKSIEPSAFKGCILLTKIEYEGTVFEWEQIVKGKGWNHFIRFVECVDGTVDVCAQTEVNSHEVDVDLDAVRKWASRKVKDLVDDNQNPLGGCELINDFYIKGKTIVKYIGEKENLEISDDLTSIGADAFYNNNVLKQVLIPNSITYIGSRAFQGCVVLNNVIMGNSVKTIGGGAFSTCRNLTEVIFPESIRNINSGAFSGCNSLTTVIVPKDIKQIKDHAFAGCNMLESLIYKGTKEEWEQVNVGEKIGKSIKAIKCIDGDIEI